MQITNVRFLSKEKTSTKNQATATAFDPSDLPALFVCFGGGFGGQLKAPRSGSLLNMKAFGEEANRKLIRSQASGEVANRKLFCKHKTPPLC